MLLLIAIQYVELCSPSWSKWWISVLNREIQHAPLDLIFRNLNVVLEEIIIISMSQIQRHTMEKRMVVGREGGVLIETPLTFKHLNSSSYVRNTIKSGKWSFPSMAFPKTLCLSWVVLKAFFNPTQCIILLRIFKIQYTPQPTCLKHPSSSTMGRYLFGSRCSSFQHIQFLETFIFQ